MEATAADEDPGGTATSYDHFVVLEVLAPWPDEIHRLRGLPETLRATFNPDEAARLGVRSIAVLPDAAYSRQGYRHVIDLRRRSGSFAEYERRSYLIPAGDLDALADALIGSNDELVAFDRYATDPRTRDLLICTHGAHDACCATFGFPVYQRVRDAIDGWAAPGPVRVWRASHLGGHRFAPNAFELPSALYWASLDESVARAITERSGDVSMLRRHYRGWAGLRSAAEQLLDREAFVREGWSWLSLPRRAVSAPGDPHLRIEFIRHDGSRGVYAAEAHVGVPRHQLLSCDGITGDVPRIALRNLVTR